jgi:hypothetical protein
MLDVPRGSVLLFSYLRYMRRQRFGFLDKMSFLPRPEFPSNLRNLVASRPSRGFLQAQPSTWRTLHCETRRRPCSPLALLERYERGSRHVLIVRCPPIVVLRSISQIDASSPPRQLFCDYGLGRQSPPATQAALPSSSYVRKYPRLVCQPSAPKDELVSCS